MAMTDSNSGEEKLPISRKTRRKLTVNKTSRRRKSAVWGKVVSLSSVSQLRWQHHNQGFKTTTWRRRLETMMRRRIVYKMTENPDHPLHETEIEKQSLQSEDSFSSLQEILPAHSRLHLQQLCEGCWNNMSFISFGINKVFLNSSEMNLSSSSRRASHHNNRDISGQQAEPSFKNTSIFLR